MTAIRRTSPGRRDGNRFRWAVASVVTIAVLVVSTLGFMILTAGAATSGLVGYVPAGAVGYLEIRLDAPGDQRQNAANLLSHFPGFADQSTLGTKMDEALDQLVRNATGGRQTFTGDIKGWLGDSLAVVLTRLPPMAATGDHPKAGLVMVGVKDPAAARAWADLTLGPATGAETYAGIALSTIEKQGSTVAYGVFKNVLLAGDPQSVRDAIDSRGAGLFGDSASFKAAAGSVSGDRLAFGYLDLRQVGQALDASRSRTAGATALAFEQLPAWVAVSVRAESDSLAATVALPDTNLAPVAANHTSVLANRLPGDTVAAGELHDVATLVATLTTGLRGAPATPGASGSPGAGAGGETSQLDQALQALGGLDALVGWMGDATVAAVPSDGPLPVAAGIVVQAKDAAGADAKLTQLKNLVALAGATLGITTSEEIYGGTAITVIDLGSAAGAIGGPMASTLAGRIAIAQQGDLVIVGLGDEFVKAVLDTRPGASLADRDTYRTAIEKAGAANTGQLFVDLQAVLDLATKRLPADELRHYQDDIRPYLAPFRAFAASGSAGDPNRGRIIVTVK